MGKTLLDILVNAGEAYLSMVGSKYDSYPYSYETHKHEFDDNTPSSTNRVVVSQNIGLRLLSRPASWTFRFVRYRLLFSWSTRISFHLCTSSNI